MILATETVWTEGRQRMAKSAAPADILAIFAAHSRRKSRFRWTWAWPPGAAKTGFPERLPGPNYPGLKNRGQGTGQMPGPKQGARLWGATGFSVMLLIEKKGVQVRRAKK